MLTILFVSFINISPFYHYHHTHFGFDSETEGMVYSDIFKSDDHHHNDFEGVSLEKSEEHAHSLKFEYVKSTRTVYDILPDKTTEIFSLIEYPETEEKDFIQLISPENFCHFELLREKYVQSATNLSPPVV